MRELFITCRMKGAKVDSSLSGRNFDVSKGGKQVKDNTNEC